MTFPSKLIVTVGVKFFDQTWQIRQVNLTLDTNNDFLPIWPMFIEWPDGKFKYFKCTESGNMLYAQEKN